MYLITTPYSVLRVILSEYYYNRHFPSTSSAFSYFFSLIIFSPAYIDNNNCTDTHQQPECDFAGWLKVLPTQTHHSEKETQSFPSDEFLRKFT